MTENRHGRQGLPEFKLHDPEHEYGRRKVVRAARIFALVVVLLLLLGLGRTLFSRWTEGKSLEARADENAVVHVHVIHPRKERMDERLTLPGTLQAMLEAQIYARASGYVKQWFKNIGDPARKGDVLATLEIPEVQRQVEEAQANYRLAKIAFERWTRLRAQDAVSQQELDEKTSAYRQTDAVLQRLREQLSFGQVVAPFDGIVTRRNVNVGDLVNAGNGGAAQAMFSMAQTNRLHVYAYVPQARAAQIRVGNPVEIRRTDRPDQPIKARIARTAGAIDTTSRTLQIDIEVPNPRRSLLPGTYVEVTIDLESSGTLVLPTNSLLFGASGTQVAVVKDNKVLRRNVTIGTDYGQVVEVRAGVSREDQVIVNPSDSITNDQAVVVEASTPVAQPAARRGK